MSFKIGVRAFYMTAQTRKSFPRYGAKEKVASFAIGLASFAGLFNTAALIQEAHAALPVAEEKPANLNTAQVIYAVATEGEYPITQDYVQVIEASVVEEEKSEAVQARPEADLKEITPAVQSNPNDDSVWDRLSSCEAGQNWQTNTGNGYYGGLQFSAGTWHAMGGVGLPSDTTREQQIAIAKTLQARSGWGQWPACSAKLGLR